MRFSCAAGLALLLGASASAQPAGAAKTGSPVPPSFALLSLVGDQFSVVMRREEIGSNIDPNRAVESATTAALAD